MDCLNHIEEVIQYEGPHTIAAIFIETVTGTNGLIVPPDGYLQGLRQLCDKYGILLVCDEVMAGFGRTGEWFAVDHWNVVPDIITMAKGLTSSYLPLGAVAISDKIADHFRKNTFYGGLTYNAHPMCLAAAIETIKVMEDEDIVGNAKRMGVVMGGLLDDLKAEHPSVGDVRSIGLFGTIELVTNRETKTPMPASEVGKAGAYLKEHGLYHFTPGNLIFTNPPLIITEQQLKTAFNVINEALSITDRAVQ